MDIHCPRFLVMSCNKEIEPIQTVSTQETEDLGNKIVLGKKLENPYSVKNMRLLWKY